MNKILSVLFSLFFINYAFADSTINNLGVGAAVSGTDILPAYQGANPATGVTANQLKTFIGSPTGAASGDLSGTYPGPTVAKVNGNTPGGTCAANTFASSVSTSAIPTCTQPSTGNLSDIVTPTAWTPVFTATTPGNLAITYSVQVGSFIKMGKLIIANFNIQTSSFTWTTASGAVSITGLPFAANSTSGILFAGSMYVNGWTHVGYTWMIPAITSGSQAIVLDVSGTGIGTGSDVISSFPTAGTVNLVGTISYYTN